MIIDTFIFYNEINMLQFRLEELYNYVDLFILVESNKTFTLNSKPSYYLNNLDLYKKYQDKIINISITFDNNNPWENEYIQRNSIMMGLSKISLQDDDIIMISDVDEIPDMKSILSADKQDIINGVSLSQDIYYYNLENKIKEKTFASIVCSYSIIKKYNTIQNLRNNFRDFKILNNGGWHFSFFGDSDFIKNKLQNYAHQEFNNDKYINKNNIEYCILNHKDILDRPKENGIMEYCPSKYNPYLPQNYNMLITK